MYLNCHSYYSLRYGTLSPEQLVATAQKRGAKTLALTDINSTSCAFDFIRLCKAADIQPIIGIEFRRDGQCLFIGIAKNIEGFRQLNDLLTSHSLARKPLPDCPPPMPDTFIVFPRLVKPMDCLGANEFLGIRPEHINHLFTSDVRNYPNKLVIFSPVTFLDDEGYEVHKVLRAIDLNTLISKLTKKDIAKRTELFPPREVLIQYYQSYPQIIQNTAQLTAQCHIELAEGLTVNRRCFTQSKSEDMALLEKLAINGCKNRYGRYNRAALVRVQKELKVIEQQDFGAYFLITWDIIRYAKSVGYYHVGRGSGANSIVAFCLSITDVDPIDLDLYFERFINPFRAAPPDFDIDFSWDQRDDVIDYVFKRYGKAYCALLATYSTFKGRSIIREIGKVYGLPKSEIDQLIRGDYPTLSNHKNGVQTDNISALLPGKVGKRHQKNGLEPSATATQAAQKRGLLPILHYGKLIEGFPNYLSIHAGGILIAEQPIAYHTALQMMPKGFPIVHFDMHQAERIGYHKYDVLSQRGLGHIKDAVQLIKDNQGQSIDVHEVGKIMNDKQVQAQLQSGHCIGCFYIESPAMRGLLTKLQCADYVHLVAASSIIRPGVAKSGMMREYIKRFHQPNSFKYLHPIFEEHLSETYGVMVYQEDTMKIIHHFAGLPMDECDVLRRIMTGKRYEGDTFQKLQTKYYANCQAKGYSEALAKEVWRQVESFSGYSFCKAHSASFAVESFQSLFLKTYYPLEFMVAVINNFGGFYKTEYYFHEARMCGAQLHITCVNHSDYLTTIIGKDIYVGFVHLHQLEQKLAYQIVDERYNGGRFESLLDFVNRVKISTEQLEILIRIGAFQFTGKNKYELMWEKNAVFNPKQKWESTGLLFADETEQFQLPDLQEGPDDQAFDELELLGFTIRSPFELLTQQYYDYILATEMKDYNQRMVTMIGYYVCKKDVRTVNGQLMNFGTWLDEKGHFFDTTHFPNFLKLSPFKGKGVYKIEGKITEDFGFPSVEVTKMERLPFRQPTNYGG